MEPMTVRELLTATGGRLLGEEAVAERTITGVETDSRAVHEGDLFVALRGAALWSAPSRGRACAS